MQLRNIAIIAHVDHGKTTLVDSMFQQAGIYRAKAEALVAEKRFEAAMLELQKGLEIVGDDHQMLKLFVTCVLKGGQVREQDLIYLRVRIYLGRGWVLNLIPTRYCVFAELAHEV